MTAAVAISFSHGEVFDFDAGRWDERVGLVREDLPPGAASWKVQGEPAQRYLRYVCPCGCAEAREVPVKRAGADNPRGWGWDGNETLPSLTPSIQHVADRHGAGCTWHGFLTAGVFLTC